MIFVEDENLSCEYKTKRLKKSCLQNSPDLDKFTEHKIWSLEGHMGMIDALFGNQSAESILIYLRIRGSGHARGIAAAFGTHLTAIQQQLRKFEAAGIVESQNEGRMRVYRFSKSCPFLEHLWQLLWVAIEKRKTSDPSKVSSVMYENIRDRSRTRERIRRTRF